MVFKNVGQTKFNRSATGALRRAIGKIVKIESNNVRLMIDRIERFDLTEKGEEKCERVYVDVQWHEGRSLEQKRKIAQAIQSFLDMHGRGEDSDITFHDYPHGETFFVNGELMT